MRQNKNAEIETNKQQRAEALKDTDIILVKSLVPNVYYTCSKTLDSFIWLEAGDVQEMTFGQLKLMKNKYNGYFTKKWLYPQNEQALNKLGIADIFAKKFDRSDMRLLYGNNIKALKEKLPFVPVDQKTELAEKIKASVESGKIVNIKIIRLLEKEFNLNLMDLV